MPESNPGSPTTDATAAAPPSLGARVGKVAASLVARPSFWVIALAICFIVPLGRALALGRNAPHGPALSMALPAFRFTDELGRPFGTDELRGKVWVADFIFTSCPSVCPKLTERMAVVQHRSRNLGDAFHLVSFTVDPENDTPERLLDYARRFHASPARWSFLTGKSADLEATIVKGFKIAMGKEESTPGSGVFSVFHGERFVLVDQKGRIRGYYDADDAGVDALMRDVGLIVNGR